MRSFLIVASFFIFLFTRAADGKYPVSNIPQKLLKDADVVKRMEEVQFEIVSTGETILHRKYALTILNENGDNNAALVEYYDNLHKIRSIEGSLYDAMGNLIKKLKDKDIQDLSGVSDNNLMDDTRKKFHHFYCKEYPYTVEYQIEEKYNNTMFFPLWVPQEDERFSVEQSSYSIICDENYIVRYRAFNYIGEPVITRDNDKKKMQWKVVGLPSIKVPYASPSWKELTTMIYFAPSDFEIQGYKGNMSTWKDFGKFQYALNGGKDQLPDNIVQTVNQLTAATTDVKEKIKLLYNFLQKSTRYISIQLGLGGWQPFDAADVAKKGYGDCKALTNYMYSLLKAAGIKSNYTLVYAGSNKDVLIDDFPCNRFNHVILCVPLQKDSVWLECTSQSLAAGYMSDFTANRKALLIDEQGGTVVRTPRYGIGENTQVRNIYAKLNGEGTLNMEVETRYIGMQQDRLSSMINGLSKEKVQKNLQQDLSLSTYDVNDFKYQETKNVLPQVEEHLNITARNYATVSGKRLFITPNILNKSVRIVAEEEVRTVDFVFDFAFRNEDKSEIEIPEGYVIETAPKNISIKTEFGTYSITAKLEGNKIIYHRLREQFAGRFPAKNQTELAKFFDAIYKADRSRFVLIKAS